MKEERKRKKKEKKKEKGMQRTSEGVLVKKD